MKARGKIDDTAINFIAKSLRHERPTTHNKGDNGINDEGEECLIESCHCERTRRMAKGPSKLVVSSDVKSTPVRALTRMS